LKLRAGIIGLGTWYSGSFAEGLRAIKECDLVARADMGMDDEALKALGRWTKAEYVSRFGVKLYHDPLDMIKKENLDMVCVCHPPLGNHEKYVKLAAEAGVDVYIEKPMTTTLEGAKQILEVAKQNKDVLISTLEPAHYDGAIREAYNRAMAGEVGEIQGVRALVRHNRAPPERDMITHKPTPDFGMASYVAGMLHWFFDAKPLRVYAEYGNPYITKGLIRYEGDKIGSMDRILLSTTSPLWEIEVVGDDGIIRTQQSIYEGYVWKAHATDPKKRTVTAFYRNQNNVILGAMQHWVKACLTRETPDVTVEDGVKIIETCIGWYRASETGKAVNLPLI